MLFILGRESFQNAGGAVNAFYRGDAEAQRMQDAKVTKHSPRFKTVGYVSWHFIYPDSLYFAISKASAPPR
jgi:hypothetical protein